MNNVKILLSIVMVFVTCDVRGQSCGYDSNGVWSCNAGSVSRYDTNVTYRTRVYRPSRTYKVTNACCATNYGGYRVEVKSTSSHGGYSTSSHGGYSTSSHGGYSTSSHGGYSTSVKVSDNAPGAPVETEESDNGDNEGFVSPESEKDYDGPTETDTGNNDVKISVLAFVLPDNVANYAGNFELPSSVADYAGEYELPNSVAEYTPLDINNAIDSVASIAIQ